MKVLSLFDGMSCGQIALNRAGIKYDNYYASEIDKYAMQITQKNYPNTIQLGDIIKWREWNIEKPDLIMGGSPCQGFSFAGKGLNFEDERSKLFFVFIDILKHYKPKYFLLENVVMRADHNDVISGILGEMYPELITQTEMFRPGRLEPIQINSALVSAQNRNRLYWTNIQGITQPKDKGIMLKDIIENAITEKDKSYCIDANYFKGGNEKDYKKNKRRQQVVELTPIREKSKTIRVGGKNTKPNTKREWDKKGFYGGAFRGRNPNNPSDRTSGIETEQRLEVKEGGKSNTLTSVQKDNVVVISNYRCDNPTNIKSNKFPTLRAEAGGKTRGIAITEDEIFWRKLSVVECERLQTVPDNYTEGVSKSQRYNMLGNGWTVDVIAHIFNFIK